MKLTKKKALEECEKLWRWLKENPNKEVKSEWPEWSRYNDIYGAIRQLCPCCHYAVKSYLDIDCTKCPLEAFWTSKKELDYNKDIPCLQNDSPFRRWERAKTPSTRKRYAKIIADECARLLEAT